MGLLEKYKERLETIERVMETKSEAANPIEWAQYAMMKQQTELFISDLSAVGECSNENSGLHLQRVIPCYSYDMKITDEGTPFEINDWIPIATDRIKQPERIPEYLEKGLLRKHNKV